MPAVQRLSDRRVLITGASSGIGLAAAELFAQEGARLALVARGAEGLERAREYARRAGSTAHVIVADLGRPDQADAAVREAVEWLGGLDVLVSNAGTTIFGPFESISAADFDRTFAVTYTGAVRVIRAALPHLERSHHGVIVATGSVAARVPLPLQSPYAAAKHALRLFLASLRVELKVQGSPVRVSMVHPAPVGTPLWHQVTSTLGVQPRPVRSVYRTEVVAQALVECAVRPRAEVTVGGSGAALVLLTLFARPVAERVLASFAIRDQLRSSDAPPSPGALHAPSGRGEVTGASPGRRSLWTAIRLRTARVLRARR